MYMYDDVFWAGGRYYEIKVEVHIEQICVCKLLYSYQVSYMFCSMLTLFRVTKPRCILITLIEISCLISFHCVLIRVFD